MDMYKELKVSVVIVLPSLYLKFSVNLVRILVEDFP